MAVTRSIGKELSVPQFAMLKTLRRGRAPFDHLRGMSQAGGGVATLAALIRYKLAELDSMFNKYVITKQGRRALRTGRIPP